MMTDTVNAVVTREGGISSGGADYADGAVIFDMPENQFRDWALVGIVDRATPEQIEAANAAAEKAAAAEAKAAKTTTSKASKTA